MRIASLLASATEIVCILRLEEHLVAISHECDYPSSVLDRPRISRPRFATAGQTSGDIDRAVRQALAEHGDVYALDEARLRDAAPDLILTQAVCDVCAVPTTAAQRAVAVLDAPPTVLSLDAHSVREILASITTVGRAAGAVAEARRVVADLQRRLDAVAAAVAGLPRPRVLMLEWIDPPFVPGHWGPEMIERAGGANLAGHAAERSQVVDWTDLDALDPDVLIVAPCGYGLAEARQEADTHAALLQRVGARAIGEGRAFVVDASAYINRSGPRVIDGIELLAALLHPTHFDDSPPDRAAPWRP